VGGEVNGAAISCNSCSGSGVLPALGPILARLPLTAIIPADKRPHRTINPRGHHRGIMRYGWERADGRTALDAWQLPSDLFDLFPEPPYRANRYRYWWFEEAAANFAVARAVASWAGTLRGTGTTVAPTAE
jgi:hypothetical protein